MALALTGGTIYPSPFRQPIRNGSIVIEGEKIVALDTAPRDIESIDCSGLTITAGFWNSHVHFFERKWASAASIPANEAQRQLEHMLTRYGFTTAFDLSSMWENTRALRDRVESREIAGPRILTTGPALVPPSALPSDAVFATMGIMRFPSPEIANAAQATDATRKLLGDGVDGIKLFASVPRGPALDQPTIEAAVQEAHAAQKPLFIHPNTTVDVRTATRAGVDVIAHTTPHGGAWDDALIAGMIDAGVLLTPTLALWKYFTRHDRLSAQEQIVSTAIGQLRAFASRGGTVLFGTDLGAVDPDPTEEYLMMREAGMTFRDILASLTTTPAKRFGLAGESGQVAAGFGADLVMLASDPAIDVRAFADVVMTIRRGQVIFRRPELANG